MRSTTKNIRVTVGLSGGVDSSVTALLLQQQGYQVDALFMKNWQEYTPDGYCMWEADVEDAMQVCQILDIPMNTVDFSADYRDKVFTNFLEEYKAGRTPNPDILCNQEIKFKAFLHHARERGSTKIATGHYARILKSGDEYQLKTGIDSNKDQSYFLCRLNQQQLEYSLFPIGELEKHQVRTLARKAGFCTHNKKDSTGICFIGERPFRDFLSHYLPPQKGNIQTLEGDVIGQHEGIHYYTLGQRRGLGIGGIHGKHEKPWYIVDKDVENNILLVAQSPNHPRLLSQTLLASEIHWISGRTPKSECSAKIRHRQPAQNCLIEMQQNDRCKVSFKHPQKAVTPGQFIVFYDQDTCLGGGIIESTG